MTITPYDMALYASALVILFLTPGPVWVALVARALSGGFQAAWPLALGVAVGDAVWPLLAVVGVNWIVSVYSGFLDALRLVASAIFLVMGYLLLRHADAAIGKDSRLTRPGVWAGFAAGVACILGNPKAILFYMGVLPGFFDLSEINPVDVAGIVAMSIAVPLVGNLCLALLIDRVRRVLESPRALRRMNLLSGALLCAVGVVIAIA